MKHNLSEQKANLEPNSLSSVEEVAVNQDCAKEITSAEVKELRRIFHDLSSVFTGILVSGGLLNMALEGDKRQRYSDEICQGAERGAAMVRQARGVLTAPEPRIEGPLPTITTNEFGAHQ